MQRETQKRAEKRRRNSWPAKRRRRRGQKRGAMSAEVAWPFGLMSGEKDGTRAPSQKAVVGTADGWTASEATQKLDVNQEDRTSQIHIRDSVMLGLEVNLEDGIEADE